MCSPAFEYYAVNTARVISCLCCAPAFALFASTSGYFFLSVPRSKRVEADGEVSAKHSRMVQPYFIIAILISCTVRGKTAKMSIFFLCLFNEIARMTFWQIKEVLIAGFFCCY